MPLRLQNLAALAFDIHLFMHEGARAISTLELPAHEVKNGTEHAFDIPLHIAKMLIAYRDRFAPKIIGHRPTRLFVNVDGTPKNQAAVAGLIVNYLRRRAGIVLTPHQFRHLSAKVILDADPGGFETAKQVLGHKSIKTTVGAYAGIDSRRAARRHQYLVEQALATEMPARRSTRRHREPLDQESRTSVMPRKPRIYLPFDSWPAEDQARWQAAFAEGDRFEGSGPGSHLAEATRRNLWISYARFLAFHLGQSPQTCSS